MQKTRLTADQTLGVLRQMAGGVPAAGLCRKHGMSSATLHIEPSKHHGSEPDGERRERGEGASIALACRAFEFSETCYRYSPQLDDENKQTPNLLPGLTTAKKRPVLSVPA